jgi:hypothetical protein
VKSARTAAKASASDRVSAGRAPRSSNFPFFAAGESSLPAPALAASMSCYVNGMARAAATTGRWTRVMWAQCGEVEGGLLLLTSGLRRRSPPPPPLPPSSRGSSQFRGKGTSRHCLPPHAPPTDQRHR